MLKENTIIVLDLGQYKDSYKEKVPFLAKIGDIFDRTVWVKSTVTGKTYELHHFQVLESYPQEELVKLINLNQFGNTNE